MHPTHAYHDDTRYHDPRCCIQVELGTSVPLAHGMNLSKKRKSDARMSCTSRPVKQEVDVRELADGPVVKLSPIVKKEQLPEGAVKIEPVATDAIRKESDPEPVKAVPVPRRGVKTESKSLGGSPCLRRQKRYTPQPCLRRRKRFPRATTID